jgi:hypothetical protein
MGTTATLRNGIDVDRLLETIRAVESDPVQGSFTFSATSTWSEGAHNIGQIQGFVHAGAQDTGRVQDSSPVRDCLANPVPVKTTLEIL